MKRFTLVLAAVLLPFSVIAKNDDNAGWHFPVALTYASGFNKVSDTAVGDLSSSTKWKVPVGVSFAAYQQLPSGLGFGVEVGPFMMVMVDVTTTGYSSTTSDTSTGILLPLGLFGRYDFIRDGDISPYVRAGVRECFVTGAIFEKGAFGFYGTVGVEFSHKRAVRYGMEVGFDSTKIGVHQFNNRGVLDTGTSKDVKPFGCTFSLYVSF